MSKFQSVVDTIMIQQQRLFGVVNGSHRLGEEKRVNLSLRNGTRGREWISNCDGYFINAEHDVKHYNFDKHILIHHISTLHVVSRNFSFRDLHVQQIIL